MVNKYNELRNCASVQLLVVVLASIMFSACGGSNQYLCDACINVDDDGNGILPKGPFLQYVSPGHVLIGAQFPDGTTGTLVYWRQEDPRNSISVPFKHAWDRIVYADLSGLDSQTTYFYKVILGDQSTQKVSFVPGVKKSEPFSFMVIGDTKPDCNLVHVKLVERMESEKASFYVHLGDFVQRGDLVEEWDLFFDLHRKLMTQIPLLPVVGNHDISQAGLFTGLFLMEQRNLASRRYYKAQFGNAIVLVLDTRSPISVGDSQYRFVEETLQYAKVSGIDHVFVALHEPIYSSGKHGVNESLKEKLLPLLERYTVTAVVSGHDHHYERSKSLNGIVHIVSGGGGATLTKVNQKNFCEKALSAFHYLVFTIDGPSVMIKAVNLRGKVIDEVQIK